MRDLFKKVKEDKLLLASVLIIGAELICHIRQYIFSSYSIEPLIRIIFSSLYLISSFLFKRRFFYLLFALFALAITYFNKFNNYTSFFIICVISIKNPKYQFILFGAYILDVIISLMVGNRQASHTLIHFLNCSLIYIFFLLELNPNKKLKLTSDEIIILQEWSESGELKALESFSKNSIFKKLKEARERNNLRENEELLNRYREEFGN